MKNGIVSVIAENVKFFAVFVGVIVLMVAIAYLFEKAAKKRSGSEERILTTRKMVMVGMFSAISGVLYCFDFALPIAPAFYKLDFSELPALVAGFAFGPVAGVMVEFLKVLIKILIKSTSTAFVGDLANFLIGCMLVLPASVVYQFKKSKRSAVLGCITGTVIMTVFGTFFNAVYLIPTYALLFHMPLEAILGAGKAINSNVNGIASFVLLMVAPINIIKGTGISCITMLVYKRLSPIIKYGNAAVQRKTSAAE